MNTQARAPFSDRELVDLTAAVITHQPLEPTRGDVPSTRRDARHRSLRVARELHVGTVWLNDWVQMRDDFEEGGYKQSGRGRLRGPAALDDFLESKHIVLQSGVVASSA